MNLNMGSKLLKKLILDSCAARNRPLREGFRDVDVDGNINFTNHENVKRGLLKVMSANNPDVSPLLSVSSRVSNPLN